MNLQNNAADQFIIFQIIFEVILSCSFAYVQI